MALGSRLPSFSSLRARVVRVRARDSTRTRPRASTRASDEDDADASRLRRALKHANDSSSRHFSPGAGLGLDADAQADAAYADMIGTSLGDDALSDEDATALRRGGMMNDAGPVARRAGPVASAMELFRALLGGAHIVQSDDGRTL